MALDALPVGARLAGFAAALVVGGVAAAGVGVAVGPVDGAAPAPHASGAHHGDDGPAPESAPTGAAGLEVASAGHRLDLDRTRVAAGDDVPVAFRVLGPDGQPVTAYEDMHSEQLHLVAVRRDQVGFQHVHPVLVRTGPRAGTWETTLDLTPGPWRLVADLTPLGGEQVTLGSDLLVAGSFDPAPEVGTVRTSRVGPYTVRLTGDLVPGAHSTLTVEVSRGGRAVDDLDPYLEAYGHLVALREGDLAYLHVHPEGAPGDGVTPSGPEVAFSVTAPTAGGYRLHLDFSHRGVVRTASFALDAHEGGAPPTTGDHAAHAAH